MGQIVADIMVNFASDALFVLFSLVVGAVLYRVTERTKLLSFFGIDKSRKIFIYLSSLDVVAYGARGTDGNLKSYQGEAVSYKELETAYKLKELFTYSLPTWGDMPNILEKILLADIKVHIIASNDIDKIDQKTTLIALGSPAYNMASKYCESELQSQSKIIEQIFVLYNEKQNIPGLVAEEHKVNSNLGLPSGTPLKDNGLETGNYSKQISITINSKAIMTDPLTGFVEKIWDKKHQRYVFYVAGISEIATASVSSTHFIYQR